ncbi:hypothetical protein XENTR_v10019673 [Xenopus tropicalis]|nr:hypothetical protein XENTR_v10019673 [Xenopus tropicalis]
MLPLSHWLGIPALELPNVPTYHCPKSAPSSPTVGQYPWRTESMVEAFIFHPRLGDNLWHCDLPMAIWILLWRSKNFLDISHFPTQICGGDDTLDCKLSGTEPSRLVLGLLSFDPLYCFVFFVLKARGHLANG